MNSKIASDLESNIGREIAELKNGLIELGISFNDVMLEQFETYLKVLYSYYKKIHLLSHRDYDRISARHFLPSLTALPYTQGCKRACDVGAGAGFPSLPLKIVLPHLDLVIFESQRKKADFLRYLVDSLDLKGVEVINERAERYSGRCFDLVLFKAVGKIRVMAGLADKLLGPGGTAIFYKTPHVELEIEDAAEELSSRNLRIEVKKLTTPVGRLPIALVLISSM